MSLGELITIVISSSVIPDHPSTLLLETVLDNLHEHLPECNIIVMLDGIRSEQENRRAAYEEYKRNIKPRPYVTLKEYSEFRHQAWMLRDTLKNDVKTPLIFFCEHDWIIVQQVPFEKMARVVLDRDANFIRLHQETKILDCHKYLMLERVIRNDVPLWHCRHFWAQPHLARTDWYLQMLENHFTSDCRTFIEDKMYGACMCTNPDYTKLYIYAPDGNMKTVKHLDGRRKTEKFDDKLVF